PLGKDRGRAMAGRLPLALCLVIGLLGGIPRPANASPTDAKEMVKTTSPMPSSSLSKNNTPPAFPIPPANQPSKSKKFTSTTKSKTAQKSSAEKEAIERENAIKRLDALKPKMRYSPLPPMGLPDPSQFKQKPNEPQH